MPPIEKIKVLVTGFGPFPGVRSNPSGDMLGLIERRLVRFGNRATLQTAVIPTNWNDVETFTSGTLAAFDPDIAIHFGVHSCATGLRVEKLAQNCTCSQADASGKGSPRHCVVERAPRALKSTLETQKLVSKLTARGLPAHSSTNAGRYLCNALLFASLYQAGGRSAPRQTGFIHIPPSRDRAMQKSAVLNGAELIIGHCIARQIHQSLTTKASGG